MLTTFRVRRFNPESESPQPYFEDYRLATERSDTVLDALIRIRETVDESLTLRCSCRGAICGSCGMRINGHAALACKTKVASLASSGETGSGGTHEQYAGDQGSGHGHGRVLGEDPPRSALAPAHGPGARRRVSGVPGRHASFDGRHGVASCAGLASRTVRPWRSMPISSARRRWPKPTGLWRTRGTGAVRHG